MLLLKPHHRDIPGLMSFTCSGNRRLNFPPREIANMGGEKTAMFLRGAMAEGGMKVTEMMLIVFGDGEAGKTSSINAVMSEDDKSTKIGHNDRTVGINFQRFEPSGHEITLQVMDLAGQAVYSTMHQFFFLARAIYLFVWRARKPAAGVARAGKVWKRTLNFRV
jgi:hypothetical protein